MKIDPLKIRPPKPVAILYPGKRTLRCFTVDGEQRASGRRAVEMMLSTLTGHVCYVESGLNELTESTGAISWVCKLWRGKEVRMQHVPTGLSVQSLRGTLEGSSSPFEDLTRTLRWLRGYGVVPASIPSMAWQLWRASLPRQQVIGFDNGVGRAALYGGRQEAKETRNYKDAVSYDIKAAYPVAMASRPYALSLRPVSSSTYIDPDVPGLAEAWVYVPGDLPYAPLPVRIAPGMIAFQHGSVGGIWPWSELAAAKELGCDVLVIRVWAPKMEANLFGGWWPMIAEGRGLEGRSSTLAKAIANSTWGQFGMVGEERATRHYSSESGRQFYDVPEDPRTMPHEWTAHIAAETTARVRVKLLTEGLYAPGCNPIHVDTDGMILEAGQTPANVGDGPGQWRAKATMPDFDLRGPQMYRWRCGDDCGVSHAEWHYNASGIPTDDAPAFFAQRRPLSIDVRHQVAFDATVPLDELHRMEDLAAIADRARNAQVWEGVR